MRKGCDGGETGRKEKTDDYSGHYVIASSRLPDHRPLERRTLMPKLEEKYFMVHNVQSEHRTVIALK